MHKHVAVGHLGCLLLASTALTGRLAVLLEAPKLLLGEGLGAGGCALVVHIAGQSGRCGD